MRRSTRPARADGRASVTGPRVAHAPQALDVHGRRPPPPQESGAGSLPPARPHDPDTVLSIVAGAIDPPALIAAITALRHDLNWHVIVHASATACDIDLLYWPTGARHHVRLEEVGRGPDSVWHRVGER